MPSTRKVHPKSSMYQVNSGWQILTYDAACPCHLCGLEVESASTARTAICGACDCGNKRKGAKRTKWSVGNSPGYPGNFSNIIDHWEFPTRRAAERKMFDLHQAGVEGWSHIVAKFTGASMMPGSIPPAGGTV